MHARFRAPRSGGERERYDERTNLVIRSASWIGAGVVLVALFLWFAYPSPAALFASIDFNQEPFEDFMGPYLTMGRQVLDDPQPVRGFLYGPLFAVLLAPFGFVQPEAAAWIWLVLQIAGLCALVWGSVRLAGARGGRALFVATIATGLAFPVVHSLHWGQISLLLVVALVWAIDCLRHGREQRAALLFAAAIAVKFYPAIFLFYFLVRGDWLRVGRILLWSAILMVALPATVLGLDALLEFYSVIAERLVVLGAADGGWQAALNQTTLAAVGTRLFGQGAYTPFFLFGLGLSAWIFARMARRAASDRTRISLDDLLLVLLITPLWVRPAWPHYYVYLPVCQLSVVLAARSRPTLPRLSILLALASWSLASMVAFRSVGNAELYARSGLLVVAALLQLGAQLLLSRQEAPPAAVSPAARDSSE